MSTPDTRFEQHSRRIGSALVGSFHYLFLFGIGAVTVWAAIATFAEIVESGGPPSIEDLLLLFIYLEIGAMVGIYFKTNHMPVRFLIYVAITVLTRHLIDLVNLKAPVSEILIWSGSLLVLALTVAAVRFASFHYPADRSTSSRSDVD